MTEASSQPLLDIQTLIVRPAVEIDGTRYAMLSSAELSVVQSVRLVGLARRIGELQEALGRGVSDEAGSEDLAFELEAMATELARAVLVDVPDEVLAKLSGMHKVRIAEVFTVLLLQERLAAAGAISGTDLAAILGGAILTGQTQIGAKPSRGSSGSTAEPPVTGWRARLSRWLRLT